MVVPGMSVGERSASEWQCVHPTSGVLRPQHPCGGGPIHKHITTPSSGVGSKGVKADTSVYTFISRTRLAQPGGNPPSQLAWMSCSPVCSLTITDAPGSGAGGPKRGQTRSLPTSFSSAWPKCSFKPLFNTKRQHSLGTLQSGLVVPQLSSLLPAGHSV